MATARTTSKTAIPEPAVCTLAMSRVPEEHAGQASAAAIRQTVSHLRVVVMGWDFLVDGECVALRRWNMITTETTKALGSDAALPPPDYLEGVKIKLGIPYS